MNEFTRTIINGLKTYIQKSRGNWNQNDETAVDYIKNRTHWTEKGVIEILPETIIETTEENDLWSIEDNILPKMLVEGTVYTVIWNGIEYTCLARNDGYDDIYIGNQALSGWDFPETIESSEPFFIATYAPDNWSAIAANIGTHTARISYQSEVIHKIDKKYLPEISSIKNVLDGNAEGSVRTIYSAPEDDDYVMGSSSFAEGDYTKASGYASHAEGVGTTAFGDASHAEGGGATASNYASHAEGSSTTASGYASHAEGRSTTASGNNSHAEGGSTTAAGIASHAEGYLTTASGVYSHAEGWKTIAASNYQHIQGKYNVKDTENKYAHIVGNGSSANQSNAHTLDWQGNAWYQGDVYVSSTSGRNKDEGSKKLATEEYVDTELANLIGAAPETLDTIEELATAFQENEDVIETLNSAIVNKVDKTDLDTEINKPKDYITLNDVDTGYIYIIQMKNGNLVSHCAISSIEVTKMPNKTEYVEGEYLDITGMVITATCYDGNTFEITGYTYTNEPLVVGENKIEISYTEYGITYTTSIIISAEEFNPEITLIDFNYTVNDDKTYTITNWKQTLNGEPSTEMVVPNYSIIKL